MIKLPDLLQEESDALFQEYLDSDFETWEEFFEQSSASLELRKELKEEDELYEHALKEGIML